MVDRLRRRSSGDLVADVDRGAGLGPAARQLGDGPSPARCGPADIAVLVRKNERGEAIREALVEAGVPAVMHGASSVFASPMAAGLADPADGAGAAPPAVGPAGRADLLLRLDVRPSWPRPTRTQLTALAQRVRGWSRLLAEPRRRRPAGGGDAETRRAASGCSREVGGERRLTDLRHLGQSLHARHDGRPARRRRADRVAARADRRGPSAAPCTDGTRRLETDAEAVTDPDGAPQQGTGVPDRLPARGLGPARRRRGRGPGAQLHQPTRSGSGDGRGDCVLDVGGRAAPGRAERFARHQAEDAGEDLRLLYVALTRAQCQVVTWWAAVLQHAGLGAAAVPVPGRGGGPGAAPRVPIATGDPLTLRPLGPAVLPGADEPPRPRALAARPGRRSAPDASLVARPSTASSTWTGAARRTRR